MNNFGKLVAAVLLTLLGVWVFMMVWNNGVVKAVTVTREIDFVTALLLVLVFFPSTLALGASLFFLPAGMMSYLTENNMNRNSNNNVEMRVRKPPMMNPSETSGSTTGRSVWEYNGGPKNFMAY
jgi:hypothetical protein